MIRLIRATVKQTNLKHETNLCLWVVIRCARCTLNIEITEVMEGISIIKLFASILRKFTEILQQQYTFTTNGHENCTHVKIYLTIKANCGVIRNDDASPVPISGRFRFGKAPFQNSLNSQNKMVNVGRT